LCTGVCEFQGKFMNYYKRPENLQLEVFMGHQSLCILLRK